MIRDETHRRELVDQEFSYDEYPELIWTLRRRFRDQGLTGYVFVLENTTKRALTMEAGALAVDWPNRAALVQLDHDYLGPRGTQEGKKFPRLDI